MARIKFGTDGWRAVISDDFTFENVRVVGQAVADFVRSRKEPVYRKKKFVVGYDTRFLSDRYAEIVSAVLAGNGIKVILSDRPNPTPAICVCIKDKKLTGGIMVTASHNPPHYNGIKYKGFFGGSAGSDIIDGIEKRLHRSHVKSMVFDEALRRGKIIKQDIVGVQLRRIKKYADMKKLKTAGLKVLVDSMNGTGGTYFRQILKNTGIKMDFIHAGTNPGFGGRAPEPNEKNLKELMKGVKKGRYDLGLATDGDADRIGVVDEKGNMLSGHKVMALLLLHFLRNRNATGGVVQTICGTALIDRICEKYGLRIYETPVGFKYICDIMTKNDILIGGEETGGVGFKNYIPERDGFLTALLIMELMISEKKPLGRIVADMNREYGNYVYEREDMIFPESSRKKLMNGLRKKPLKKVLNKPVREVRDYDGSKFICEDGSWLLLRLSGTEPKLRVYSETRSGKESLKYLKFGKKYALSLM
ncbi:MAG: phosphoglucomutase/phosphomannomutase family protein [Candidatus Makaraimicrobium thalassicum]|nr:MAG: phosphoglucomutase/phosphomannomutase family protein [Candidatus Omnitrophota bacterium]